MKNLNKLDFLSDGEQRMRTTADQLQMRSLYTEFDLISAEIQNIGADGQISLHTRSMKYGKLENGQLIIVPSSLVKRLAQHYISFPWGVDTILGRNGYIWITSKTKLNICLSLYSSSLIIVSARTTLNIEEESLLSSGFDVSDCVKNYLMYDWV
jgi:exosome complex RNA-binding protein Rrp4